MKLLIFSQRDVKSSASANTYYKLLIDRKDLSKKDQNHIEIKRNEIKRDQLLRRLSFIEKINC